MKILASLVSVVAIAAAGFTCQQDRPNDGRRGGPRGGPYLDLFDTDHNGEISKKEIQAAAIVLTKLDKNQDGKLTRDELPRPPRPGDEQDQRNGGHSFRNDQQANRSMNRTRRSPASAPAGTVVFIGGYQTDRRDGGRPVALIAAALGVKPQIFRDAFSNVRPSRNGPPSRERERMNKEVLMNALSKHGITNDRLDEVSNYYRYRPESGQLWRHTPAAATAIVENGKVTGFKITNAGSGYMVAPTISVAGHPNVKVKATIGFGKTFSQNGRVTSLELLK
ncbi:MAG: hypothetical protein AB8G99_07455 [Planctomycetaceae bacterium]